ncbi:MAG: DUF896 domain-containing protein [Anaerovoracaceae bacterium]|jgi:uncharacterized protein YnzC (UPF0291/DUF896 family)
MIGKNKIDRINELAAKARTDEGLTDEEIRERDKLRREYVEAVKQNVRQKLKDVKFVEDLSPRERDELIRAGKLDKDGMPHRKKNKQ